MTTLVLKTAGSLVGGALLGPFGAAIGGALGAAAGYAIDQAIFGGGGRTVEGPRLSDLEVQTSTEGASIPRLYGRARLNGQIIWATNFTEKVTKREQKTGAGKGGIGSSAKQTTYSYYANFAVGLCEGEIGYVGRIWANGTVLDLKDITYRVYRGTEDQLPDSLIEAKQGSENCPAYRGLAYVVFENLPLADFGNRIPQLSFEVVRPIGELESQVRSMVMIPGATEFGYDTTEVSRKTSDGVWESENRHVFEPGTDFEVSLSHLMATCPNLERVALVISWFGSDLRAGNCAIRPCVDNLDKQTSGAEWSVAGLDRSDAHLVSQIDGRAAYGGTPSDASVIRAIAAIKSLGLEVVLYPFIMMDIPPDNQLPDPYGESLQAAFPWRGRITCYPGPEQSGSVDKTNEAANQVAFFYDGQAWSYRNFILHYAQLTADVGGVDAFLLGSELRGLSQLRDQNDDYPFVTLLQSLAFDVRQIVGSDTKITYAADWSEYFGHHPANEAGTVKFHLDPLWADSNIDAIGIDNYMPLSDWRPYEDHADAWRADTCHDPNYLKANIAGGEGFDWYYASNADRADQNREAIADGAKGKDWVYRYKDLVNWWSNEHFDRDEGVEAISPTPWIPQSKPIWFTELGCPAVDLGATEPNRFPDSTSSEGGVPYFSTGARDDMEQRAFLSASLDYWNTEGPTNPVSSSYALEMVTPNQIFLWAWDARPFPAYPLSSDVWSDGASWHSGHWLNGRLGGAPLEAVFKQVASDYGIQTPDVSGMNAVIDGFVIDRRMSARAALEGLCDAFGISFASSSDKLIFQSHQKRASAEIERQNLVDDEGEHLLVRKLEAWETETASMTFSFKELFQDYRQSVARYDQPASRAHQDSSQSLAIVSTQNVMIEVVKKRLRNQNFSRHSAQFALPPSMLAIEPGDQILLKDASADDLYTIDEIEDGDYRQITAVLTPPRNARAIARSARSGSSQIPTILRPEFICLDLPLLPKNADKPHSPYLAIYSKPWNGGVSVYSGSSETGFQYQQTIEVAAIIGELTSGLPQRHTYMCDNHTTLDVLMLEGDLASITQESLYAGGNAAAVMSSSGEWEILQFQNAELLGPNHWRLTCLLRGQLGTEKAALSGADEGARFILLDEAIVPLNVEESQLTKQLPYRFVPVGAAISDPSRIDTSILISGRALRPLSPVHLRANWTIGKESLEINWIRRGRTNADSWASDSIPLDEETERYRMSIKDAESGDLVRELETTMPSFSYSLADRINDGVSDTQEITIEVAQISRAIGDGDVLSKSVNLSALPIR